MGQSNIKLIGNEANNNTQYQIYIETGSFNLTISKNNIGAGGTGGVDVNIASATLERNWWSTKDTTALYARISGTGKSSADFTPFRLGAVDTVTATDTVAPQAPDTVSAVSPGAETATITWSEVTADEEADDNPPNLTKYLIYRSTTSDPTEWILKMEASSGSTSATDSGLTPGTVYYYRVTAIDNVSPYRNESFYSDSIASITPQLPVILISEVGVGYSAEPDSDFVELFVKQSNSNGQPINLNGWRIFISTASATASRSKKTFSNLIVSESSFVTVYFASGNKADETEDGSDSRALTYADSSNSTLPATQALIQLLSPYASDTQDAVYYSDQSSLNATLAAQLQDLVVAGQWSPDNTAGNTVSDVGLSLKGSCIRRDASFTDNNTKADWSFDSQTPGNMPLSRFYVSTDNSNPNVGDSFTLTLYAIDTRNDTIIGARFKVDTNISSGSMLPSYLKFITDHSDWNSGDTSVQAAIFGTSGDVVCTFSVNGGAQSGTVALTVSAPLSDLEVIVPEKVLRSSNFSLYIRAKDSVGNTKTDFTGAVNIGVDSYTISQNSITFTASDAGETTIQVQITGVGVITITCSTAAVSGYDTTVSVSDTHLVITEFLINENNRPGTTIDRDEFIELY
ncbi:TPA: hypothetical protein DEF17_07570, partial [bacterium]|nr:hypothetical protein [bacterium]